MFFQLFFLNRFFSFAQDGDLKPSVSYPVYFDISPPLKDMIKSAPVKADNSRKEGIVKNIKIR